MPGATDPEADLADQVVERADLHVEQLLDALAASQANMPSWGLDIWGCGAFSARSSRETVARAGKSTQLSRGRIWPIRSPNGRGNFVALQIWRAC